MSKPHRLHLLGESVRLSVGDVPVRIEARAGLLLGYLALAGPTSRDRLAALLWPDTDRGRARGNLRQLLLRLRLAAPVVLEAPVHPDPEVWIDVHVALEDPLVDGVAGGLFAAVDAGFSPALGEWLNAERTRFAHTVQARLASSWRALGEPGAAQAVARAALVVVESGGNPARVARAALEFARSSSPAEPAVGPLLDALENDLRVPERFRAAARRVPRGQRCAPPTASLEEALRVTLG